MRALILGGRRFIGWHIASTLQRVAAVAHVLTYKPAALGIVNPNDPIVLTQGEWIQQIAEAACWHGQIHHVNNDQLPLPLRLPYNFAQDWFIVDRTIHNTILLCMTLTELADRLAAFRTEQPVDRITISEEAGRDFHVTLTLQPNIPISERLIGRLETVLGRKIAFLSIFRVRANVMIIRFLLPSGSSKHRSRTDHIEEVPAPYYTSIDRRRVFQPVTEMLASC
jgi:hypothetical protein